MQAKHEWVCRFDLMQTESKAFTGLVNRRNFDLGDVIAVDAGTAFVLQ